MLPWLPSVLILHSFNALIINNLKIQTMLFNTNEKGAIRMSMTSLYFYSFQYYESLYTTIAIPF